MTDQTQEVATEFVDMNDLNVLTNLQKEHQLVTTQAELAATKIELVKLQLKIKYNLSDADEVNIQNGLITRK